MVNSKFVGTWKLVSFEIRFADGSVRRPFGDDPVGTLMYDDKNGFAAQVMRPNRRAFESNDLRRGTPEEIKEAFEGYAAYFGPYEVKDYKTVIHKVKGSLFPNWIGDDQIRYYKFFENYLELSAPSMQAADVTFTGVLTWERAV